MLKHLNSIFIYIFKIYITNHGKILYKTKKNALKTQPIIWQIHAHIRTETNNNIVMAITCFEYLYYEIYIFCISIITFFIYLTIYAKVPYFKQKHNNNKINYYLILIL